MKEQLISTIEKERRKGRGTLSNHSGRFDAERQEIHDGWDIEEERPHFHTFVQKEFVRSLICRNTSPDLPFDRSINPYRGCEHGCVYCYARPSHAYLGYSPGLDFETRLIARPNAAEVLERELRSKRYSVAPLAVGTNTDPYQPIEKKYKIMRQCLKILQAFNHPVTIVTKGALIERDIDVLAPMARKGLVQVGISVTSLNNRVSRLMEPRVPLPARRIETIRRLADADIPVRVMASPIIPALTDHEIEAILEHAQVAGAQAASWIMLRLPREVSDLFIEWARAHFPDRAERMIARITEMHGGRLYDPEFGRRMRGEGLHAQMVSQRFKLAMRRSGLTARLPPLDCGKFAVPFAKGDQLSLF